MLVSTTILLAASPADMVATIAAPTTPLCRMRDTKPTPKNFFFSVLRLDSIRVSNTRATLPLATVIVPKTVNPLVAATLQNDDRGHLHSRHARCRANATNSESPILSESVE